MTPRRIRELGACALVAVLVSAVVAAAVQADARRSVRTDTNDGGAWLVRRVDGVTGHLNRAVGEVSGAVRVADPGAELDVEQADGIVLGHDRTRSLLSVVDPRTFQVVNTVELPEAASVHAISGGAVVWRASPLQVWTLDREALTSTTRLEGGPVAAGDGAGRLAVTFDERIVAVDVAADVLRTVEPSVDDDAVEVPLEGLAEQVTALSASGDTVVAATAAGLVTIPLDGGAVSAPVDLGDPAAVPAQPAPDGSGPDGNSIVAVRGDGSVVGVDTGAGTVTEIASIGAARPLPPIVHDGCIFTVGLEPPTFTRICGGVADQTAPLTGADPDALRLRLVNGWVWINDLTNGTMWIAGVDTDLERIDDWGNALGTDGDDPDEDQPGDTEEAETEENPDVGEIRDQEIDEDGVNEPPVARDDVARTRTDTPVVVDVVDNDEDPDGDALMVTEVADVPAGTSVAVTADRGAVQVVPPAGHEGPLVFRYTVSDGRGGSDSATVTVDVTGADAPNRPPLATTDVAEVRGGASATFNVLNNDDDPDGDPLVLVDVTAPLGRAVFDPSGQVTYTPDPASRAGTIELEYTVADAFGATATGTVRVAIRIDTSNNEPDAVNDTAVTVVGRPVTFNVLTNDTDPDNDPLTIAGLPQLVSSDGNPDAIQELSLSDDGELFFLPSVAGDYVFLYTIIDGSERDSAYIRVRVSPADENRPPVAVRDDVTIPRGTSRNVYALANDVDLDGDVLGVVGWSGGEGIEVEQVQGFAFRVTVLPDAPDQSAFTYTISDGTAEPVTGTVVVAVSDAGTPDQPPVARPDTLEVRPGRTGSVRVLTNDTDPEGGSLRVVDVSPVPGAQLRIGPGGQDVVVTVDPGVTSSFTFGYDVADEGGNRSGSLVHVRPVPEGEPNRPPVARPDVARTTAGAAIDVPVLANDTDPDGDAIQLESIAAQPAFGVATVGADGSVRYEPGPQRSGSDRFRYTIVDANGERALGEVIVGVMPPDGENRPPTATDDTYTVVAGSDVAALDVLANDSDPDGDPLVVTAVGAGAAPVELTDDGTVAFEPPRTVPGSQQLAFTYDVADGRGGTDSAVVTVDVVEAAEPLAPIAVDDIVGPVQAGGSVTVDVLANDSDPDGRVAELRITSSDPAAPVAADGTMTLAGLTTTTSVEYTLTDPDGLQSTARVTAIVVDNVAPVTSLLEVETPTDTPIEIDVGPQVSDADGDPLFFTCCDGTRGGAVEVLESAAGVLRVRFTPDTGTSGDAGFAYAVDDQNGHVVSGAVLVTVLPPENTPPTAADLAVEAEAGATTPVSLAELVDDPDVAGGDVLTFDVDTGGAPVAVRGDLVEITPPIDATGSQFEIAYAVTDAAGASASATVAVTVTEPAAPPPTATPDTARTAQEQGVSVPVLANDVDPLGQGLRITGANVTDGSGSATVTGSEVVYQPAAGYFGQASFTYTIEDARRTDAGRATGTATVTVIGRPGVPSTPQATAGNATATVTWALPPANGAPLTDVELQVDDGPVTSIGVTSTRTLTGLTNGQAVTFRVRAANEAGWGEWSPYSAPVTPDTRPGRPASPNVTFADEALILDWVAPPNEGSAITGYEIEIGGGASEVRSWGTQTTYRWEGLTNGTNHQFRISAVNAAGTSDPSPWSAAERPLREPGAPGTPVVERGNRTLDLSWGASEPNGDPVIEYQVEMRSQPGQWVSAGADRTYRWSDLQNGVEQEFRVRARNRDVDWSEPSGWSAPVKPCGVPLRPAAPTAQRGDGSAVVSYERPGDEGCAITAVQVRANGSIEQAAGDSPHTFTGLSNGTSYTFEVRAQNEEGWGEWSPASNAVTPAGPPIGPNDLSASPSGVGCVDLSWPAADPNGSPLTGYQLSINGGAAESAGSGTSTRRCGLADSTRYELRVRACNDVGCGAWSPTRAATTNGPPNQMNAPNASAGNGSVSASWGTPGGNGLGVDSFDAEIEPGSVRRGIGGNSTTWNDAQNGTSYRVRVRACNEAGCGTWSAWSQRVTPQAPPPPVRVTRTYYGDAQGQPGCSSTRCSYVRVEASGLQPNTVYSVSCQREGSAPFGASDVRSDGAGNLVNAPACWYGYAERFRANVGPYDTGWTAPPPP